MSKGKNQTFFQHRPYRVYIIPEDDKNTVFTTQNARGREKILFSTDKPTRGLKLLREHFDLSESPELKKATGL